VLHVRPPYTHRPLLGHTLTIGATQSSATEASLSMIESCYYYGWCEMIHSFIKWRLLALPNVRVIEQPGLLRVAPHISTALVADNIPRSVARTCACPPAGPGTPRRCLPPARLRPCNPPGRWPAWYADASAVRAGQYDVLLGASLFCLHVDHVKQAWLLFDDADAYLHQVRCGHQWRLATSPQVIASYSIPSKHPASSNSSHACFTRSTCRQSSGDRACLSPRHHAAVWEGCAPGGAPVMTSGRCTGRWTSARTRYTA